MIKEDDSSMTASLKNYNYLKYKIPGILLDQYFAEQLLADPLNLLPVMGNPQQALHVQITAMLNQVDLLSSGMYTVSTCQYLIEDKSKINNLQYTS